MGVVNLCWNEFFSKAKNKNVIKIRGWVKICWNDFQSKANDKNVIKGGGRVKLCWNDFPSKSNKKVRCQSEETYESCQIMLE